MQQTIAGKAGSEFANATNPSCVEMEHMVRTRLADRKACQQHSQAVLCDTWPMQHSQTPASEPLFSNMRYLVFPRFQEH